MAYSFVLTQLDGTNIGGVLNADDRRATLGLSGNETASFKVQLDNPLVSEVTARNGDVLLKVYDGTTLEFVGDLTTAELISGGWKLLISRENLINRAYSLPADVASADVRIANDSLSQTARGLYEAVTPSDVGDAGMRQAWVNAQIEAKANPQLQVTIEPSPSTEHTMTCTFAGPLWRLQKRLCEKKVSPLPITGERSQIAWALITGANLESDTGIRQGTLGTTISTIAGPYYYKPIQETISELAAISAYAFEFTNLALDDFGFSGNLASRIAPYGGTWAGAGDTDDFTGTGTTSEVAIERNAVSDSAIDNGRYAVLSNVITGAVQVQADVSFSVGPYTGKLGVIARYTDANNWVMATIDPLATSVFSIRKRVAGTVTVLDAPVTGALTSGFYTIRLKIQTNGFWEALLWQTGSDASMPDTLIGYTVGGPDTDLATAGALDDGKVGLYDANTTATASRRLFDSFHATHAYSYFDDFSFTGALASRTSPTGVGWSGGGDADDFQGQGTAVSRTAVSDSSVLNGRYAPSEPVTGAVLVQVSQSFDVGPYDGRMGVLAHYTDINNCVMAFVSPTEPSTLTVTKRVAGAGTTLGTTPLPPLTSDFYKLRLQTNALGNWAVWLWPESGADPVAPLLSGEADTDIATSGALANGNVGIYDANASTTAVTRLYDSFFAAVPVQAMEWQTLDFSFTPFEPTADVNEHGVAGVKIAEFNCSQSIGAQKPEVILDGRANGPGFGTAADEYDVGDTVTARGMFNGVSHFNGLVRVFKVDISIDKEGKVTGSPTLTAD